MPGQPTRDARTEPAGRRVARPVARGGGGLGSAVLIALLIVAGTAVLLYPMTASWFAQLHQSQEVNAYGNSVEVLGPVGRAKALEDAHAYNATLSGGAVIDPFTGRAPDELNADYARYAKQLSLSPDGVMARLRIPSIDVDLPVLHGTSDAVLERGVGHLFGTALPVGGPGTHAVLTGHTGVPEAVLFSHLDKVRMGEVFTIEVYGEVLSYRVSNIQVVLPTQTESLRPVPGKDLVSMITCTPVGINSHRLIVTGERIPTPPGAAAERLTASDPGPPWWALGLLLGLAIAAVVLWVATRRNRRERRETAAPRQET